MKPIVETNIETLLNERNATDLLSDEPITGISIKTCECVDEDCDCNLDSACDCCD